MKTLTESQYMELRKYEDGNDHWQQGGPLASLVSRGYIRSAVRQSGFYRITEVGSDALTAFRIRYGIAA